MKTVKQKLFRLPVWWLPVLGIAVAAAQAPSARRINRAIELLEHGQPIYYTGSHEGTEGSFEQGMKDAQTWADYISYDMEHAPFDVKGLAEYMRGLAKGGPTRSGHRTPAVIVNVPVNGTDEGTVRANAWMFHQVLATGVHGLLLCHADSPGAVRAFVEAVRFPIHKQSVDKGISEGRRGVHGATTAARIWGLSTDEYLERADVWPLNPRGELLLGPDEREDRPVVIGVDVHVEQTRAPFQRGRDRLDRRAIATLAEVRDRLERQHALTLRA